MCIRDSYDDAYNCAVDALLEIRSDLISGKLSYGNLESYFTTRSKLFYGKYYNRQKLWGKSTHNMLEEGQHKCNDNIEASLMESDIKAIVAHAISKLCKECQHLIELHYYKDLSFKKIAEEKNKRHDAILQQIKRCRKKFRDLVGESFYLQSKRYFK